MREKIIILSLILINIFLLTVLLFLLYSYKPKEIPNRSSITTENIISDSESDIPMEEEKVDAEEDDETESIIEEDELRDDQYSLSQSAWLPPWYFPESFSSLRGYEGEISVVNPVFYGVNSNGSLLNRKPSESKITDFLKYCEDFDISVIPTIGSYSYDITDTIFATEISYKNHVEKIIEEIDKYDFDGIDIDYEKIRRAKKDNYINFLSELRKQLSLRDKILSVTIFPQLGDNVVYENHVDTIYSQDLSLISNIADQVRVMTYDYTLSSSPTPGPIAPIYWMEDVLKYILTKIPNEKVWLGVHLYGYRWRDSKVTALTPSSYKSIVSNPNINSEFREDIGEGFAEYSCDGSQCFLYYQTREGIILRKQLALEYQIAGVSYWSLGRDDGLLSE